MNSNQWMNIARQLILAAVAGCVLAAVGAAAATGAGTAASPLLYSTAMTIPLGGPDRWDYLTYDDTSSRLYVAHATSIDVLDMNSGKILGHAAVAGANGVVVVPAMGKGYAGSSVHRSVVVFDLKSLAILKELPADEDTDGVIYDDVSRRVFVMDGDPHNVTVVDSHTDTVIATVALHGKPEFAVADGRGKLFVNITDKREIQRIDTATAAVDATWPVTECDRPHGLSIDRRSRRLFATCLNAKMLVLDAADGHILATLPIGAGSDASEFDARRNLVFSSNGSGTLSVIREVNPERFDVLGEVPTQPLARTMAIDPINGRVFLVAADRIEVDPAATDPRKKYAVRPGSVHVLVLTTGAALR